MSYALLESIGVPQPETVAVRTVADAEKLIAKYGKIVIKPIDGAHGLGVTAEIDTAEKVEQAIRSAEENSTLMGMAVAQPQLDPNALELRVICIGYKFVEAIARIPARVTGDGEHSLEELIQIENATIRTKAYQGDLAYVDETAAMNYLGERKREVPKKGECVRVVASCNLGQGGTVEDRSAQTSDEMRKLAEKIARTAELPVIGIDFYGDQVIEINAAPSLYYPTGDETATKAVIAYVDYLETL